MFAHFKIPMESQTYKKLKNQSIEYLNRLPGKQHTKLMRYYLTGTEIYGILNIVQYEEVSAINTVITSKDEILKTCREIVAENGLAAVNMRDVAKKCDIALGSLYYYFPSKDDLILDTIMSVWQSIFHMDQQCRLDVSFPDSVEWVYKSIRNSADQYPNFFTTHSLGFATEGKNKAKSTMEGYLKHIRAGLAKALNSDPAVRKNAFSKMFPEKDFIDFVLNSIIDLLLRQKKDCNVLLEMIRRTIY